MPDPSHTRGPGPDIIRVAYVVHTFDMGGLERCVAHLCNLLDRSRFAPMVICLNRNGAAADWIAKGDVPIVELHKRPGNDLRAVLRLARTLRQQGVDVVHSHNWGTLVETSIARRWARVPVHVHTEHGQELHERPMPWLKRRLQALVRRWAFRRAEGVVICAESVRHRVHAHCGFARESMRFIANGVTDPAQSPPVLSARDLRGELGIASDAFVAGTLSRLVPIKNLEMAVDATSALQQRGRDVHLLLVGDGPEKERLRARAQAAGCAGQVHLAGHRENVADWLRLFDVYVNSSLSEAMSMGILEAMALGVPVVATNVGDNSLLVDGEAPCGLIVPAGDHAGLATAIERLADNRELARRLGESGRERYAKSYTVARMIERHSELYLRVFQTKTSRSHLPLALLGR